jgi:hypothetical protein
MLFPHVENIEKLKRQGHDLRDFCGENGRENFVGFGAKVKETVNAKNEVLWNLKVKLMCNSAREWKATWVGLDEAGPLTNARGPPPASPTPTTKQVWKPTWPQPTWPAPNKDQVNSFGSHITQPEKPVTHKSQVNASIPKFSSPNQFSIFEFGDSSGTSTTPTIDIIPQLGLSQGSSESEHPETPALAAVIPRTIDCPPTESFTSEVSSLQGVDGLAKTKADSFSVTLENLELWPVGNVVHTWGTPQDWVLELKDGQRLHLPMEIEKFVHKEISHQKNRAIRN